MTQRENYKQTTVLHAKNELYNWMMDPSIEINDIFFANEETAYLSYSHVDPKDNSLPQRESKTLSIMTGAYCTSCARLLLYSELSKLGDRLLYCDTDSIVYIETDDPNEYRPKLGPNIGDLVSEVPPNCEISEFICVGPKSYSIRYRHDDGSISEKSKLKGFVSTAETRSHLCFDNFKKMIFGCDSETDALGGIDDYTIETKRKCINRKKYFNLVTAEQTKRFGFTFDKRLVCSDFTTVPFGYEKRLNY